MYIPLSDGALSRPLRGPIVDHDHSLLCAFGDLGYEAKRCRRIGATERGDCVLKARGRRNPGQP